MGLWTPVRNLPRGFRSLSLSSQFLIAAGLVLCGAMAVLGSWITTQIAQSTLKSAAVSSAAFMDLYLEPNVQVFVGQGIMPPEMAENLDRVLAGTALGEQLVAVNLWQLDGTVLYSTQPNLRGRQALSPEIARASRGEVVALYKYVNDFGDEFERAFELPLIEVYAPLRGTGTNEIIAVGEYYLSAPWLTEELARARNATWFIVGATTLAMLGLLFLIVLRGSSIISSQRSELRRSIVEASQLAAQNEHLRLVADEARLAASEANEQLLARIGSDLHDGPIQLGSLLMLELSAARQSPARKGGTQHVPASQPHTLMKIAGELLTELRNISAGLSLPEIETLSLAEALRMAVFRHEDLTGMKVALEIADLPDGVSQAVKICAYRVVQESLNNAYKHAGNVPTKVEVSLERRMLHISVMDEGPGLGVEDKAVGGRQKLGIAGIRNRVSVLKGTVQIASVEGVGTRVSAVLPLDS